MKHLKFDVFNVQGERVEISATGSTAVAVPGPPGPRVSVSRVSLFSLFAWELTEFIRQLEKAAFTTEIKKKKKNYDHSVAGNRKD